MGLLQSETVAGTLQEPKTTSYATLETFTRGRLRNPKYFAPTSGEIAAVSTNVEITDKKIADLLLADEQLFHPYTYFSVTLHLHFHVVNPNNMQYANTYFSGPRSQSHVLRR